MQTSGKLREVWFFGEGKTSALAFEWLRRSEPEAEFLVCSPQSGRLAEVARESGLPWIDAEAPHWSESFRGTPSILISFLMPRHIPQYLLSQSPKGGLNFHPAPLPFYRGVNCATFAILNNESLFGVTCHYMTERYDDGPILASRNVEIGEDDTALSLETKSKAALLDLFCTVMATYMWEASPYEVCPHPPKGTLYTTKMFERMARVQSLQGLQLDRHVRAFWNPPRSASFIEKDGKRHFLCPGDEYQFLKDTERH
ncbi:formyltransferase family protein [Candidatus Latescibacterota bacterium]